jgi:hypothetical protein
LWMAPSSFSASSRFDPTFSAVCALRSNILSEFSISTGGIEDRIIIVDDVNDDERTIALINSSRR